MWQPSTNFKANVAAFGFFFVSLFIIGVFAMQCGLWVLIPIFAFVIVLRLLGRKSR